MAESRFQQPTAAQLAAFAAGDPLAEDEILSLVMPQLYRWATSAYSNLPQSEVQSVVNQVVAETCRPVVRYRPGRASLTTYLINLIKLRLNTLYQTHRTQTLTEERGPETHEKLPNTLYTSSETPDLATHTTREAFFQAAEGRLSGAEREFLVLMRDGEKRQEVFSGVLARYGAVSDPSGEVKNLKERLLRTLRTLAREMKYELRDVLDDSHW